MEKNFIFLAAMFLISSNAFAVVNTTAYIDPLQKVTYYYPGVSSARHTYNVVNDSTATQTVSVCTTTDICYENPNTPQYYKTLHSCESFTLKPGESKNKNFVTNLPFSYHFYGYCDTRAITEVIGWQPSMATSYGKLSVGPN